MVDIPLFDGPSFRQIVLMVGFIIAGIITAAVSLLTFVGYWVWRTCLCCQRRRRKSQFERRIDSDDDGQRVYRPVGAESNARALLELQEEERAKTVGKVKWILVYVVVWTWIFFIGAGPLVWLVIMDYLPWWAGWLCAVTVLWVGWFFFFPLYCRPKHATDVVDKTTLRSSGYVLVEDDDDYHDTRMNSINPGAAQHPDFHGAGDADAFPRRRRSRNPVRLAACVFRERARRIRRRPFVFVGGLLFWLLFIFSTTFVLEGMCIGEYPISIDFRLVRQLQPSTCSGDAPCHVYLTFPPGNMSSSIIVHFHASNLESSCASTVYYDTQPHNGTLGAYRYNATGTHFKYETKDFTRYIHWVRIDTLQPDTVYYFRSGCGASSKFFSPEKRFLSAPGPGTKNFTFVTGGDMGTSVETAMIETAAAQLDPRFVLLGGDLAYANAMPTCYRVWDKWFDMWEENMITRDGNYIPLVAIVGNHETGGGSSLHQSVSDIPFFFRYFHLYPGDDEVKLEQRQRKQAKSQQQVETFVSAPNGVVGSAGEHAPEMAEASVEPPSPLLCAESVDMLQPPSESDLALPNVYLTDAWDTTYHHHFLGDYLFLTLDSGMFLDVQGAQTAWLEQVLESWNATHNQSTVNFSDANNRTRQGHIMAVYHVPMWPSGEGVDVWQADMRKYWEPLFDSYHVAVGFENHSHRYGRATPLKAGKENFGGTLYLGGGSFGVPASPAGAKPWYMVNVQQKRHFLHVHVTSDEIYIQVIDEHGEVFDHTTAG